MKRRAASAFETEEIDAPVREGSASDPAAGGESPVLSLGRNAQRREGCGTCRGAMLRTPRATGPKPSDLAEARHPGPHSAKPARPVTQRGSRRTQRPGERSERQPSSRISFPQQDSTVGGHSRTLAHPTLLPRNHDGGRNGLTRKVDGGELQYGAATSRRRAMTLLCWPGSRSFTKPLK